MPITTIQGALDIQAYDLNRIEALAGPQGTLYGASSMAGTIKLITNRPDPSGFYGAVDLELNTIAHGEMGGIAEGFINAPISSNAAIRAVAWYRRDGGYIDNIHGSRTYPTSGIVHDNAEFVEDDYNDVEVYGGRIALGIDLNDSWTIRPTVMGQVTNTNGSFAQERSTAVTDELQTVQYNPEYSNDKWIQAALTIEGKLGSWDLVAAGGYLRRHDEVAQDYSDYAYFYDALYGYGAYFYDNDGELVSPNQYIIGEDSYRRWFGEVRVSSPQENRLRLIAGLFGQRQTHYITQHYIIDDIADSITVPGTVDNIWLTAQKRVDRDLAAFGELSYDLTDSLTATGGIRVYYYKNSLIGFFGYNNPGFSSNPVYACQGPAVVDGSPCTNLDKTTSDTDFIHKLNLTYTIDPDMLVYATWSRGFRPGGINRRGSLPPYGPDTLDNYEVGWKGTLRAGPHQRRGLPAGLEEHPAVVPRRQRPHRDPQRRRRPHSRHRTRDRLQRGRAVGDSGRQLQRRDDPQGLLRDRQSEFDCTIDADLDGSGAIDEPNEINATLAPAGARLPVTPRLKGNAIVRYEFPIGSWDGHLQGALSYTGDRRSDLRNFENRLLGMLSGYTTADVSVGVESDRYRIELFATNLLDARGIIDTSVQCLETTCGDPDGIGSTGGVFYDTVIKPRTVGLKLGMDF